MPNFALVSELRSAQTESSKVTLGSGVWNW